jgi:hypothetical protein
LRIGFNAPPANVRVLSKAVAMLFSAKENANIAPRMRVAGGAYDNRR